MKVLLWQHFWNEVPKCNQFFLEWEATLSVKIHSNLFWQVLLSNIHTDMQTTKWMPKHDILLSAQQINNVEVQRVLNGKDIAFANHDNISYWAVVKQKTIFDFGSHVNGNMQRRLLGLFLNKLVYWKGLRLG